MLRCRSLMGRTRNSTPQRAGARPRVKTAAEAAAIGARLAELYPDAVVELDHQNAYQLLVATILAAQSTDKMINTVTPGLFARYPDAAALAGADPAELEQMIRSTGYFRTKARYLIEMARAVVERHGGQIPDTMEALCALPGVARKTANVVLGCALGKNEGFIVDTHVTRLAARLGLTRETDPVKIEQDLMALVPRDQWTHLANRLIWHGRRVCDAKKPACERCELAPMCPSFGIVGPAALAAKPTEPAKPTKPANPAKAGKRASPAKRASAAGPAAKRGRAPLARGARA
jgi:endonuclease-3